MPAIPLMLQRSRFALAALLMACSTPTAETSGPVVATDHGRVRGAHEEGYAVFKGIPYAAAPVGALRWRPPQPAPRWEAVRDATSFGPNCWQPRGDDTSSAQPMSEDCLTINVWAPRAARGANLPVMVWIHGGAFIVGSGDMPDGVTEISRRGVVLVTLNYRVGRFGFFAHPAATTEHPNDPVGNFWLMDQIAALRWVHANISQFGGDPDNVTIFGVSAGGSSVNSLVATPETRGLIRRAIVHSGGGMFNSSRPLERARTQALEYASRHGVMNAGVSGLDQLRTLTPEQILAAESGPPDFGAIEDGRLLSGRLSLLFARGDIGDIDYIAGSTSDEASIFGLMGFDAAVMEQRFGVRIPELRAIYPPRLDEPTLLREVQTDFIFTTGADAFPRFVAAHGRRAYSFHFAYVRDAQRATAYGVPHGGDIPFVFGLNTYRRAGAPAPSVGDIAMASLVADYWTNFAKTGDPNGAGLPAWPRYHGSDGPTLVFQDRTQAVSNFRAERLAPFYDLWSRQTGGRVPRE